ncbi:hypothetical protein [Paenibacillus bovis]|uniref:Uncharacterized protein n=1 Tax=Paenibacillus bovis TaxID=1616788 RepID=A0A172ZDA7_9BACL|nr:hypothetical protein [Paenibacillus bovis]ANF95237.1 hypothetical protein AR543_03815 [Paenibacillus bovis]
MKQAIIQFARRELWWNLLAVFLLFIVLPLAVHHPLGNMPLIGLLSLVLLSAVGIWGKHRQLQA